jgi:hypothetical protein
VFVTGSSYGPHDSDSDSDSDYVTVAYRASSGAQLWGFG